MTNHISWTWFFLLHIIMGWQYVWSFWIPPKQFISCSPNTNTNNNNHHHHHHHHYVPRLYAATTESYHVQVQYEGKSCDIQIQPSETILEALERTDVANRLAVSEMPFDCRKGNCMTCSAKLVSPNQQQQQKQQMILLSEDNGLSPEISKHIQKHGYLLTCSSYVQGDGLIIKLGQNHQIWQLIYQQRLENESTRTAARAAVARLLRRKAEKNVEKWALEVEALFEKSGNHDNVQE